ncbi:MAG: ROK family protein [Rhodanobacteraceae bacterium]
MPIALALDLGGTKIAAARVSDAGVVTSRRETATPPEGGQAVVAATCGLIEKLSPRNVRALGVCIPGLVHPDGSVWAPNIKGWTRMQLATRLAREFQLPVTVESDRDAFVTGEAWRGAARGCQDVVFLAIGTGIGAGIISGGHLLRGCGGVAGALGWMAVESRIPRGFEASYRDVGCLESHLAGPGIARAASRAFGQTTNTRELLALARKGDPEALEVLARAGHYLGLVMANLVSTLNPERIIVGGGMAAAGDLLLGPARTTMRQWGQPIAVRQVKVVRSRLGLDASLLGTARLAFDHSEAVSRLGRSGASGGLRKQSGHGTRSVRRGDSP